MRKVISLFLIVVLISGCNRMSDNVNLAPQSSNVPAPALQSSNAPASELQPIPTPAPTADANPDLDPVEELCGGEKNVDLYCFYASLSALVNLAFLIMMDNYSFNNKVFTMLKMVSSFSFPVHVYLTNPSFLSKSKLSLTALAVDTCLSLFRLITKNPLTLLYIGSIQSVLELVRFLVYPHVVGYLLS